jgi:hypothetical protein
MKIFILIVFVVVLPFTVGLAYGDESEDFAFAVACAGTEPCVTEHRLSNWGFPKILYACLFLEDYCSRNLSQICQARNRADTCDDMLKAFHNEMNKPREEATNEDNH